MTTAILRPPDYDERLLLLGSTKSGKTEGGRQLIHQGGYRRFVVFDWKGDVHLDVDHLIVHDPPWQHSRAWKEDRVLYRPLTADLRAPGQLDRVLRWVFERQQDQYDHKRRRPGPRRIVWVDEAFLWLIFALQYLEDEREVVKYTKGQLTLDQLEAGWRNHGFWEVRRQVDRRTQQLVTTARLFPPLRIPTPQEA